jgi:hypothetical protein
MTVGAVLLALPVSAFVDGPTLAADLCLPAQFKCNGFEPNWQFVTGVNGAGQTVVRFTDPENPNWQSEPLVVRGCVLQGSPNDFEVTTGAPLSLIANIVGQRCIEPNEDVTDFSVTARFVQGAVSDHPALVDGTGCCERLD